MRDFCFEKFRPKVAQIWILHPSPCVFHLSVFVVGSYLLFEACPSSKASPLKSPKQCHQLGTEYSDTWAHRGHFYSNYSSWTLSRNFRMTYCSSLSVTVLRNLVGSGTFRRCDSVGVGMAWLEELWRRALKFPMLSESADFLLPARLGTLSYSCSTTSSCTTWWWWWTEPLDCKRATPIKRVLYKSCGGHGVFSQQ